jgi:tetratricopeptide (TPR) repeat protein
MQGPDFEKMYETARTLFEEGKLDEAERLFLKLLDRNPQGYADIHNRLGLIYFQKGFLERAAQHLEKALSINPNYTDAALNLVVTYNEMKRFDEAEKIFSKAAQVVKSTGPSLDPFVLGKLANEHKKLGDAYYELGRSTEALHEYEKAIHLCPNFVDILTKIGIILFEQRAVLGQKSLEEAIHYFIKAKEINPRYLPASIHLGIAYYCRGDVDLAVHEWKSVLKVDPTHRGAQAYLAMAKKS